MSTNSGTNQSRTSVDADSELVYLTTALKAPASGTRPSGPRDEGRSREKYLAARLEREVAACDSDGAAGRIRTVRFPSRKSLEEWDYGHQQSVKRKVIAHLGTLACVAGECALPGAARHREDPPRTGLGIPACQAGHRGRLRSRPVGHRLAEAHQAGRLSDELTRLGPDAADRGRRRGLCLLRPEAAKPDSPVHLRPLRTSLRDLTGNEPFGRWGEDFGDDSVAAMIARLVHHTEVILLKGGS
ncbi:ATP-binding protein [Streptomyces chartreusis]|uniref:ATP-binding protein n=1 Tax=Streptomyces chartreusis TaxID=1969 RepID=UPI003F4D5184